jgi:hypothetical protein
MRRPGREDKDKRPHRQQIRFVPVPTPSPSTCPSAVVSISRHISPFRRFITFPKGKRDLSSSLIPFCMQLVPCGTLSRALLTLAPWSPIQQALRIRKLNSPPLDIPALQPLFVLIPEP